MRSRLYRLLQRFQGGFGPFGANFDPPIGSVAHESADSKFGGAVGNEVTKADALHAAGGVDVDPGEVILPGVGHRHDLKERGLATVRGRGLKAQVLVGKPGGDAPPRGAGDEPELQQVGLVIVLKGGGILG